MENGEYTGAYELNDVQKERVKTIGDEWNSSGCAYDTRESEGMVYMVVLSIPSLEERGAALKIDVGGKSSWVTSYPLAVK